MTVLRRLRRPRIDHRSDGTLALRPSYLTIVGSGLLGAVLLVACVWGLVLRPHGNDALWWGLLIATMPVGLAVWGALAREPMLEVGRRGLSAPMTAAGVGLVPWENIARVYVLHAWSAHLAVDVWRDPDDHDAGTRLGLTVSAGMLPMRLRRVLAEIEAWDPR